ncbi:uncharacterized protein LOC119440843 [Dermacentor silvarum]|uniref:uncharacterized protein LOC119440843 n=1 Tax=Dermacentor silvarum TaxID=543639 RepID=UPI0021011515|nr:uncharacterized protein LOC119440843 [Dermacentor silvarum]
MVLLCSEPPGSPFSEPCLFSLIVYCELERHKLQEPSSCSAQHKEFQREVLTRLSVLRIVQQQQGELLTALTTRCTVKQSDNAPQVVVGQFDSYDELKKFDQTLTGPVKEAVVQQLANIGGPSPESCTRRVLRSVLSDKLASTFSWHGRKGKNAFDCLLLSKCIVDAVKVTHKCDNFVVESASKDWLRHAPARCASEKSASHPSSLPD